MTTLQILIRKPFRAIDCRSTGAISVDEVATLDHEVLDDAVEFAPFVALRLSSMILVFSRAKLSEVLGGAWDSVGEELHLDPSERFAAQSDVEEDDWIWLSRHSRRHFRDIESI